jgi:hypothetical protein
VAGVDLLSQVEPLMGTKCSQAANPVEPLYHRASDLSFSFFYVPMLWKCSNVCGDAWKSNYQV